MNTRPVAAAFFVVFCLLLCGLILRRQIAAHPLPPDAGRQGGSGQDIWTEQQNWPPAPPSTAKQVRDVVRAEIAALGGGNAAKAMAYRSRFQRQRFSDPNLFLQFVRERHPEIMRDRVVRFGPVQADPAGENAWTMVWMEGPGGERSQSGFVLGREDGLFKISRIYSGTLPN